MFVVVVGMFDILASTGDDVAADCHIHQAVAIGKIQGWGITLFLEM